METIHVCWKLQATWLVLVVIGVTLPACLTHLFAKKVNLRRCFLYLYTSHFSCPHQDYQDPHMGGWCQRCFSPFYRSVVLWALVPVSLLPVSVWLVGVWCTGPLTQGQDLTGPGIQPLLLFEEFKALTFRLSPRDPEGAGPPGHLQRRESRPLMKKIRGLFVRAQK